MIPVTQETLPDGTIIVREFNGEKWIIKGKFPKSEALND